MEQPSYLFLVRDGENSCPLSIPKVGKGRQCYRYRGRLDILILLSYQITLYIRKNECYNLLII